MKAFSISEEQIVRVAGAAAADELSRRFDRHVDFLTIAAWDGDTAIGAGGLQLGEGEARACEEAIAALFGAPADALVGRGAQTLADWSRLIATATRARLDAFTFKSASRNDASAVHRHGADEIFQDAAAAANLLYGRRRLLSFVAPHSLIGFVLTILSPGLQQIDAIDARGMTPEELSETLAYGDVLVATPTLWRYMVREKLAAPDNTMAVSFGEPMTGELAAAMRKAGFGALREFYGSTETGLIGWRDGPAEAFTLFDHWARDGDGLRRRTPGGDARSVAAMDHLSWESERAFRLAGRRDGVVQIGAVNVAPDEVARRLKEHPYVADCDVRAKPRGDGVNQLTAHIVLAEGIKPVDRTAREIDAWCRTSLRRQERPRVLHFERSLRRR